MSSTDQGAEPIEPAQDLALEPAVGPAPPPTDGLVDPAPWGLRGAVLIPVAAYGTQIILAMLLAMVAWGALALLDPGLIRDSAEKEALIVEVTIVPLALVSSLVTLGLVYFSVVVVSRRPLLESLHLKRPAPSLAAGFTLLGCVMAILYISGAIAFPPSPDQEVGGPLARLAESGPVGYAIWMALATVMAPLVEEVLFRGYAYLGARRALGPAAAGAGVTVVFTLMHAFETGTYWPALAGILALSALLIVVMERTGNLTYCICCHLGYNAGLGLLGMMRT